MNEALYTATPYRLPIKKLLLNQFGSAMLGIMLWTACMGNIILELMTSLFAVFFFMLISYTAMWDIGASDRIRYDGGRARKDGLYGLKAAALANIPNFILALFSVVGKILGTFVGISFFETLSYCCNTIAAVWQSMYLGIIGYIVPKLDAAGEVIQYSDTEKVINILPYFAIIVPSLIICTLGYNAGFNNLHLIHAKKKEK